jgi:hypothetical protein
MSVVGLGACWSFGLDWSSGNGPEDGSTSSGCGARSTGVTSPCYPADPSVPTTPPSRPTTHRDGGATRWFILRSVRLGEATRDLQRDACAWKSIGFDLDGRETSLETSKLSVGREDDPGMSCHRRTGSYPAVLVDGVGGIDNNFGGRIIALFESLNDSFDDPESGPPPRTLDEQVNDELAHGAETMLLRMDNVFDDDEASAPGALYATATLPSGSPGWMDSWPVYADSLVDGVDLARARVVFPG